MNLTEKKRIEEIILDDIQRAITVRIQTLNDDLNKTTHRLCTSPVKIVADLIKKHREACEQFHEVERKLEELGYRVDDGGRNLRQAYNRQPKEIVEINEKIMAKREEFAVVKREFLIRLFADNPDSQKLIADLTIALSKIK